MKLKDFKSDHDGKIANYESILEMLEDNKVFEIKKIGVNFFVVRELCDAWFEEYITREQLIGLGQEIIALANDKT
jgi:hypothetical protein